MASAAQWSFVRQVIRELPSDWTETIMKSVREVDVGEVKKVIKEFLLPIFESKTTNLVVTCAPIMQEVSLFFYFFIFFYLGGGEGLLSLLPFSLISLNFFPRPNPIELRVN